MNSMTYKLKDIYYRIKYNRDMSFEDVYKRHNLEYDRLYEGLIRSYPKSNVMIFLDKKLKKYSHWIRNSKQYSFTLIVNDNIENEYIYKILKKLDETYGWKMIRVEINQSKSNAGYEWLNTTNKTIFYMDCKIEMNHPQSISNDDLPKKLYHVSPTKYKLKILKKGLIPKSMNKKFKHKDRVYFTSNKNQIKTLIRLLAKENKEYEWSVYEIDTRWLGDSIHIFVDSLFKDSYFTKNNISSSDIKHIKDIKI